MCTFTAFPGYYGPQDLMVIYIVFQDKLQALKTLIYVKIYLKPRSEGIYLRIHIEIIYTNIKQRTHRLIHFI